MLDPIGNVFLNLVLFRNPHFQKTLFNIGATIYPLLNSIAHSALEVEKSAIRKMFRYLQVDGRLPQWLYSMSLCSNVFKYVNISP